MDLVRKVRDAQPQSDQRSFGSAARFQHEYDIREDRGFEQFVQMWHGPEKRKLELAMSRHVDKSQRHTAGVPKQRAAHDVKIVSCSYKAFVDFLVRLDF